MTTTNQNHNVWMCLSNWSVTYSMFMLWYLKLVPEEGCNFPIRLLMLKGHISQGSQISSRYRSRSEHWIGMLWH